MMITGWTRVVPGAALLRGCFLWASLLGVGFLAGCGDFWQAPSSTTTTTPTGASSGVFYVLNQQTAQIAGYSVVSGTLTPVSGSPYTLPGSAEPLAIAIAPNGTFLYVSTALDGIYLYTTGSGGALTLGNSSSAISADLATSMQVDATNQWLVEGGPNQAILHAIAISSSTGLATSKTEQTVPLPATTIHQLTISPDNTHIFVALGASGTEEAVFAAGKPTPSRKHGKYSGGQCGRGRCFSGCGPPEPADLRGRNCGNLRHQLGWPASVQFQHAGRGHGFTLRDGRTRPLCHLAGSKGQLCVCRQPNCERQF